MKDVSQQRYWFKRRRYGYGWTPVTWQGWVVILSFLVIIVTAAVILLKDTPKNTFSIESAIFLALVVVTVALAVVISLMKGPKPKWRWGRKDTDSPNEDI